MRSLVATALLCVLGAAVPVAGQNLVVNGDFENGPRGWTTWRAPWGNNEAWDFSNTEPGHLGTACLKLGNAATNSSFGVYQQVTVKPGHTYLIDAYWKGQQYGGPYPSANNWYEILLIDGPWDPIQADSGNAQTVVEPNYMYAYDNNTWPLPGDFGWIWTHDQNAPPDNQVDWNNRMGMRTASGHVMTIVLKAGGTGFGGGVGAWFDDVSLVDVSGESGDGCTDLLNGDFSAGTGSWSPWIIKDNNNDFTVEVIDGELSISGTDINGGVYQQFNTGGAGNVINITGFWRSEPTLPDAMWGEVWVINADRVPVDGVGEVDGFDDAVLLYRNNTYSGRGAWADAMAKSSPLHHRVSFVANGDRATLILKSINTGPNTLTGVRFDNIRAHCVPPPGTINSLPPGFSRRTFMFPDTQPHMVCIAESPVTHNIYAVSNESAAGNTRLYRIDVSGANIQAVPVSGLGSIIPFVQGMTFDASGNLYLSSKTGRLVKGVPGNPDSFSFSLLFDLDDGLIGLGSGDHGVGGLAVGGDGKIYINSGSSSHYGYLQSGVLETYNGKWNSRILRANLDGSGLETYAEGIRNTFDLAFSIDGRLFGVGNGPNIQCDYAEEVNLIEQGNHYGFPYEYGSDLSGGDASIVCNNPPGGNVAGPPAKPGGLVTTPAWANYGPDAKPGVGDLGYADGGPYYGFDPHRSPDGISFYNPGLMDPSAIKFPEGLHGRAFVAHFGELEPIPAVGHDVTSMRFDDEHAGFVCNTFLTGFDRPIDVLCSYNGKLYILEYTFGGGGKIHEIAFDNPVAPLIGLDKTDISRTVDFGETLGVQDTFTVSNVGLGTLDFTVTENVTWLDVSPGGGSSDGPPVAFTIMYNATVAGLSAGEHVGTIQVSDNGSDPPAANSPLFVTVTLNVKTVAPDFDQDGDVDMTDHSYLQACYSTSPGLGPLPGCEAANLNRDIAVDGLDLTVFLGCFSGKNVPPYKHCDDLYEFQRDSTRGGAMYDNWWVVAGVPAPAGDHPLWALRPDQVSNPRTGSATHRCKECHGWDYKGVDGAYGAGDHRTGFPGIADSTLNRLDVFTLLKFDGATTTNGHGFGTLGLSDQDLWDITEFVVSGVIDTDLYVAPNKAILGDTVAGGSNYTARCNVCHQSDGTGFLPSGHDSLGLIANENPWEVLHKIRFGSPGTPMPTAAASGWSINDVVDTGAYVQTLPQVIVP